MAVPALAGTPSPLQQLPEDLARWWASLAEDPRIPDQILRFEEGDAITRQEADSFAAAVRTEVLAAMKERVPTLLQGACNPMIQVTVGESENLLPASVGREGRKRWEDFQGSLIRTEMVACIQAGASNADAVLDLYVSPEFRMAAESRIIDMWEDSEGSCMETKGVLSLVEPTRVCNRIAEFKTPRVAAQHSQVVFNEGRDPYQDVYFKESVKTFVQLPDGVALHYINFTRAAGMGRLERWIGPGKIKDSQEGQVDELRRRLNGNVEEGDDPHRSSPLSDPSGPLPAFSVR